MYNYRFYLIGCVLFLCPASVEAQSDRGTSSTEQTPVPPGAEKLPPPTAGMALAKKEKMLAAREAELEQSMKDLKAVESRLDKKIARLEALIKKRKMVEEKIKSSVKTDKDTRLSRVVAVTGKMPPESAALYLTELSVDTAAKILGGIKPRQAAAIMSAMLPSKAAEISRKYMKIGKPSPQSSPPQADNRSGPNPKTK